MNVHRLFVMVGAAVLGAVCPAYAGPEALQTQFSPVTFAGQSADGIVAPVSLDPEVYVALGGVQEAIFAAFPIGPGALVDLLVHRVESFSWDAQIVLVGPEGEVPGPRPEVEMFAGKVVGDPESHAFIGLSPFGSHGYIETQGRKYILSSGRPSGEDPMVVYDLGAIPEGTFQWTPFECGADLLQDLMPEMQIVDDGSEDPMGSPCRSVEIALETDTEYFRVFFTEERAIAYTALLFGAVSEIYGRDVNTTFEVVYLRLWTFGEDPWWNPNMIDQLIYFQDYWNQNMRHIQRDVAHFLSARPLGGGVAYLRALCHSSNAYGLSAHLSGYFPYPIEDNNADNWDLTVVAHELGHNFGALHTHDLEPPVDRCADGRCEGASNGTIMSYCHLCPGGEANIVMRFHERTIAEGMLPFLAFAPCDLTCPCQADFNSDGIVNTLDFIGFLNAYNTGDDRADFNGDGVVNTLDFIGFLNAYNEGCP